MNVVSSASIALSPLNSRMPFANTCSYTRFTASNATGPFTQFSKWNDHKCTTSNVSENTGIALSERPHKCEHCGKSFKMKSHLSDHVRIHTGERPFECKVCGRRFTQSSGLTSHRRVHTGQRPYTCKHCGRSFRQSGSLQTHITSVH